MFKILKKAAGFTVLGSSLLLATTARAHAQYDPNRHSQFYDGTRRGGQGDYYGHDHRYDDRYQGQYQGHGVGTGRGALIGGAGGAALGALFGGGMKGALIGGGAGAGIGAIAGHAHQQSMKRRYYDQQRHGYYYR